MGRISSMAIKRTARTLVKENTDLVSNFEKNKEVLNIYVLPDKQTRNKIAGYITRMKKSESKKK